MIVKAMRQFRQVSPPIWAVVIFGSFYIVTYSADYLFYRLNEPVPQEVTDVRWMTLSFFYAFFGAFRGLFFNPFNMRGYASFLVLSPWQWPKELPRGPVHLIWVDVITICIIALLSFQNGGDMPVLPLIAFLGVYLASLGWSFLTTGPLWVIAVWLFIGPFAVYPHKNPNIAFGVLIVLYGIGYIGLRSFFRNFPWNTNFWKSDPIKDMRKAAIASHIGWPYKKLNIYESVNISFLPSLIVSALVVWWVHVVMWIFEAGTVIYPFLILGSCMVAFVRFVIYAGSNQAPISLWGRIFTFNWIIPRYDYVYIAPVCIILAGVLTPLMLGWIGVPPQLCSELTIFTVLLLAFSMPPNLQKWRLTSASRITRSNPKQRTSKGTTQSSLEMNFKAALSKSDV